MVDTFATLPILGPLDMLNLACEFLRRASDGEVRRPTFKTQLVSIQNKPMRFGRRVMLRADATIAAAGIPDVIFIPAPSSGTDIVESLNANRGFVRWIKACSSCGTRVVAFCTGSFLLAETGLLDGRAATTHWQYADVFRKMYPKVDLQPERLIVDEGNVITAGAATSFQDLILYLIELYCGREAAIVAGKNLALDIGRRSQLPFTIFSAQKTHGDEQILRVQDLMESESHRKLTMKELAKSGGMSMRNFDRRFRSATGGSPSIYLQKLRVERAKRLLENGNSTVQEIMWQVGYEDYRSFHRLFRALTALSPKAYRLKYASRAASDSLLPKPADQRSESAARFSRLATRRG